MSSPGKSTFRVLLLGPFALSKNGRPVDVSTWQRPVATLLKLLVIHPHHRQSRDIVLDTLWPDAPVEASTSTLRSKVHLLRQGLGAGQPSPVLFEKGWLSLNPIHAWEIDLEEFEQRIREGADREVLEEAIALYRSEPLPEHRYDDWAIPIRARLQREWRETMVKLACRHIQEERPQSAIPYLEAVLQDDPLDETALRQLLKALLVTGKRVEALRRYQGFQVRLREELGVEPEPATHRIVSEGVHGTAEVASPVHGLLHGERQADVPSNLPAPLSSFVGRTDLTTHVRDLLHRSGPRLMTLIGPGGIGKTRTAIEVGHSTANSFPDGTFFISLAELRSPSDVVAWIATTLGFKASADATLEEVLIARLLHKRALLILDNFEHVLDAAPAVAHLAEACPGVHILATSREPLHIRGEQRLPVPSLDVPRRSEVDAGVLMQVEAIQLFTQRAKAIQPEFSLTDENARAIASICRGLEGLPLAIELAAARVKEFSPWALLPRLDEQLDLLTGGPRDVSPRHSSVRSAIEWSYRLLEERERMIFNSLGVFRGGFSLDAARAVSPKESGGELDLQAHLLSLTEKNLVNRDCSMRGEARFTLLEPIREHALEKVRAAGIEPEVKRLHAEYYRQLAERAETELWAERQGEWFGRLALEAANLSAALEYAFSAGDFGLGLTILGCLWRFWIWQGNYAQWRAWLEEGLAAGETVEPEVRGKALFAAAFLAQHQGEYHRAQALSEENLALSRALGDQLAVRHALCVLGLSSLRLGHPDKAALLFNEMVDICRHVDNRQFLPPSMFNLGMALAEKGDVAQGASKIEEALKLFGEAGEKYISVTAHCYLGHLEVDRKRFRRARELFVESLRISEETDYHVGLAHSLEGLAVVDAGAGRLERPARLIGAAAGLQQDMAAPLWLEDVRLEAAMAAVRVGLGACRWDVLVAEGRAMALEEAIAYALASEPAKTWRRA